MASCGWGSGEIPASCINNLTYEAKSHLAIIRKPHTIPAVPDSKCLKPVVDEKNRASFEMVG